MKKTIRYIGYFLIVVAMIELSIRAATHLLVFQRTFHGVIKKDTYKISCYGDSFTYGLGALSSESYPSQLERLCQKQPCDKNVVVVNHGIPSLNSSSLVKLVKQTVPKEKPDCIVFLGGANNFYNFENMEFENIKMKSILKYVLKLDSFFSNSKLYKITKYVVVSLLNSNPKKEGYLLASDEVRKGLVQGQVEDIKEDLVRPLLEDNQEQKEPTEKRALIEKIKYNSKNRDDYKNLAYLYRRKGKYKLAELVYKMALRNLPGDIDLYFNLGGFYDTVYKYRLAIEQYEHIIDLEPDNKEAYIRLTWSYKNSGDSQKALDILGRAIEEYPHDSRLYNIKGWIYMHLGKYSTALEYFKRMSGKISDGVVDMDNIDPILYQILEQDLLQIIKIAKINNCNSIFLNYPDFRLKNVIDRVAREYNVPFADLNYLFSQKLEKGAERSDYFVPDGHCNKNGYALIAEEILKVIKDNRFF